MWIWAEAQNVEKEAQVEKGGVSVRALLSKRPLDLKEVAVKYVSLSVLSECKDLIFFTLLSANTYGKLF